MARTYTGSLTKVCKKCNLEKSLDEFHKQSTGRDGRRGTCKSCRIGTEAWKGNVQALRVRNARIRYGLTSDELDALGTSCHACGTFIGKMCIDHSHTTSQVRGLLCQHCNVALGMLNDDPKRLRNLLEYLEGWTS